MGMIKDPALFKKLLDESMPKFVLLFEELRKINLDTLDNPKKYLVSEMYSFYSASYTILNDYSDQNAETQEFKDVIYPVLRRLLESCFRIIYIFDDNTKINERYEEYLKMIEEEYNSMLNDLQTYDYPTAGLPAKMYKFNGAGDMLNLRDMLNAKRNKLTNDNGDPLTFLYPSYRVLSFYAHGNINKEILDVLSPTNNTFSVVNVPSILKLIANQYVCLVCNFWPDIKSN